MASNKKMHMPIEMTVNNRGLRSGLNQAQAQFGRFADQTSQKMQKGFGITDALGVAALLKAKDVLKAANAMGVYVQQGPRLKKIIRGIRAEREDHKSFLRTPLGRETRHSFIGPTRLPIGTAVRQANGRQHQSLRGLSRERAAARTTLGVPFGTFSNIAKKTVFSTVGIAAITSAAAGVIAVSGYKLMRDAQASAKRGDAYNSEIIKAVVEKDIKQFRIDRKLSKETSWSRKLALDAEFYAKNRGGAQAANAGNLLDAGLSGLGGALKGQAGFAFTGGPIGWALGWNNGPFGAFGNGGQS